MNEFRLCYRKQDKSLDPISTGVKTALKIDRQALYKLYLDLKNEFEKVEQMDLMSDYFEFDVLVDPKLSKQG